MCTGFMGPLEPIVKTQLAFSEEAAFPMSHSQSPFLRNEPKDVLTYWFPFCSCVTVIFKFKSQIHTVTSNLMYLFWNDYTFLYILTANDCNLTAFSITHLEIVIGTEYSWENVVHFCNACYMLSSTFPAHSTGRQVLWWV